MPDLGRYIERAHWQTHYKCAYCVRTFGSLNALEQHCRTSSSHHWCPRCECVLRNEEDWERHVRTSPLHNICTVCDARWDFPCLDSLLQHQYEHHPMCGECNQIFVNENNLRMHQRSHLPRDLECYGCSRAFPSFSAMLIHLEAGNCPSGSDRELINDLAFECYQSRQYATSSNDEFPFYCPACTYQFPTLSGLFQHAETRPDCDSWLGSSLCLGKLQHYISWNVQPA